MFNRISNLKAITKLFNNVSLKSPLETSDKLYRGISTTLQKCSLNDFFDVKDNWGSTEVKCGRSWKTEELRLKSSRDLHKLWYVLLKERNMLLTMEEEGKRQTKLMPNPERLDKVEESMENLETVVRERNKAYHELETGEKGERPGEMRTGPFGLRHYYKKVEYPIPKFMNNKWKENHHAYEPNRDTEEFLVKYREKLYLTKKRQKNRDFNHVVGLLKRFPNMDMQALREQYPEVDIEKAKNSRRYRPHFEP